MDERADANGDTLQDARCDSAQENQPSAWSEIQHADVLVHRQGCGSDKGVLHAARRRQAYQTIVADSTGEVRSCDVPYIPNLTEFNAAYLCLTQCVAASGMNHDIVDSMVIGSSALARYEIDGAVGMYSGIFNNPFLIWGRYRKKWFKTFLKVSFQFHHTQMDGAHAAHFLDLLQREIDSVPS